MKESEIGEIIKIAEAYCEKGISWHHHFLVPKCQFNEGKNFQIILENEETGESFVSIFKNKPMVELELLERLFFKRQK